LISKREVKENEKLENTDGFESDEQDQYMLDVYFGFDAMRCADPESKKRATLVYHSRRAGRLIKEHQDARGELSLSAGGTTYCQGLTIIVDDKHGHFPLNPTKTGKFPFLFERRVKCSMVPRSNLSSGRFCFWRAVIRRIPSRESQSVDRCCDKNLLQSPP
jgi:hypothetical protein